MGTKENFNQAMHEVFPFYKNAKASGADNETGFSDFAGQADTTSVKLEAYPSIKPLDFESLSAAKKQENIETTHITKDTKITGTIVTRSNIDISGDIYGDVESQHSIRVSGKIEGNINGKDIEINSATIKGNIQSTDQLSVTNQSKIIGNITANDLEFNGNITGNINAKKEIIVQKDAGILGDISAGSISIERGAVIKGMMTILGDRTSSDQETPV